MPTRVPVASVPTLPPPPTQLPPTLDLTAMAVAPAVTAVPPTHAPTRTPTPVRPGLNIIEPTAGGTLILGQEATAHGLVQLGPSQSVWLTLHSANGRLLAETQTEITEAGWQAVFTPPEFVSGVGTLAATVRQEDGEVLASYETEIVLEPDTENSERYLTLYRPLANETAVGGYNLFFDGWAQRPVNLTVTISVWTEECQKRVSRQSFILRGSGYWQGFVVIPNTVSGPGCAVAHFGAPEEDTWREVQIPVLIRPADDAEARGVRIGNPPPDSSVTAGRELLLYGTALNASDKTIHVTILLENGRIITDNNTQSDYWGYWELPVLLPEEVEGAAEITVTAGSPGDDFYAEAKSLITIEPGAP
ncbi:MAG: hypothetical protein ACE5E7_09360 [Anaerolineae bacterium]